jgi:hypothetical protein
MTLVLTIHIVVGVNDRAYTSPVHSTISCLKRGLTGPLVVVDEVIQSRIYKPLWRLDAL